MDFKALKSFILQKMNDCLSPTLHYHGVHHTISVMNSCITIAKKERVSKSEMTLVHTAALLHDVGFIWSIEEHEKAGAEFAATVLPDYHYAKDELDHIHDMILATKIPQSPQTKLAKILCDADLSYLGSDYFYTIGKLLFEEYKEREVVSNEKEWNQLQIDFLKGHTFHTPFAKQYLAPKKEIYLNELIQMAK